MKLHIAIKIPIFLLILLVFSFISGFIGFELKTHGFIDFILGQAFFWAGALIGAKLCDWY